MRTNLMEKSFGLALVLLVANSFTSAQNAAPEPPGASATSSVSKFFNDLGPQLNQMKAFSSLLSPSSTSGSTGSAGSPGMPNPADLTNAFTSLMRSVQDQNSKTAANLQQAVASQVNQNAENAAQAQTGLKAAFADLTQGLQKIATNNPSLVPDVKNLYQSVSSKLSSSTLNTPQQAQAQTQIEQAIKQAGQGSS